MGMERKELIHRVIHDCHLCSNLNSLCRFREAVQGHPHNLPGRMRERASATGHAEYAFDRRYARADRPGRVHTVLGGDP